MFKKLLLAVVTLVATMGFAFADVDVNKGDQAALDGIKGIGPAKSKAIIEERSKGGNFKDWTDFEKRVKGVGEKSAVKLSEAGLTVNGQTKPGVVTKAPGSAKVSTKAVASAPVPAVSPVSASSAAVKAPASSK
ncbi:MAG: helix-hairpin-helix domain-containing protein [Undibacterium sp.]|uniref:ComEA family DNA-binding protein n=1 Tax=Undibacterium sp. TaxID=1914977 RepID=UPI00272535CA|nr:helix-hairpin-helix domain-containing protein [Undibacterium sp.]MDO8650844.1 helix-hairpin-helix domain-containing protein [Undibacterium sp.]